MLFYGSPGIGQGFSYINGFQEPVMDTHRFGQNEFSENLHGIHMLIVLMQQKILQNEQEISYLQRCVERLERENYDFRERIDHMEATVSDLWQNCINSGSSNDSGTYSEVLSDIYDEYNEGHELQNMMYNPWTPAPPESAAQTYDPSSPDLYWQPSEPVLCYFYGVPTVSPNYVNNENLPLNGQEEEHNNYMNSVYYSSA